MSRYRTALVALVGLALIAVGVTMGLDGRQTGDFTAGTVLLALVALVVAIWKIRGSLDTHAAGPPVPWADGDRFATPAPERTDREPRLSGEEFARVIDRAGTAARNAQTVDDGITVVRPALREVLGEALVQGGQSQTTARAAIDDGDWTDDRVAASVLSASVDPPAEPLRDRFYAWLVPERVVRRRAVRAMDAVADAADEALPTVPGQTAPRNVPVLHPRLEELQRGADGRLQRAIDPTAIDRGPRPPGPRSRPANETGADLDRSDTSSANETGTAGTTGNDRRADGPTDGMLDGAAEEGADG